MKLTNKFILVYLLISLFVFSIGGVISFYTFSKVNDNETDAELKGQAWQVSKLIEKNIPLDVLNENQETTIKQLGGSNITESRSFSDTIAFHHASNAMITYRKIKDLKEINNKWFKIEIHNSLLEPDDTIYGVLVSSSLIYLLLVFISLILSFFISKWLLNPFNVSLNKIESFSLHDKQALTFPKTNTKEFDRFNQFVHTMTKKALADYNNLREFSENIAHEIRTPLAIASGKLDLLLQVDNLKPNDIKLISEAQQSIKKISSIQHSLRILSRIENEEFSREIEVNISEIIESVIEEHADITALREIEVSKTIDANLTKMNDPAMIEMLVTNLFQNAVKHNIQSDGFIHVSLNQNALTVENSGNPITQSTSDLMERFKKNGNASDSLGLGLSIVKDICLKSGYSVMYDFDEGTNNHRISVFFQSSNSHQN